MTKSNLVKKVLSAGKKTITAGAIALAGFGFYSNDANAQKRDVGITSDKGLVSRSGKISEKLSDHETYNTDSVYTYMRSMPVSQTESLLFVPAFLSVDDGNRHHSPVFYTPQKLETSEGKSINSLDIKTENELFSSLAGAKGEGIDSISRSKLKKNLHVIKGGGREYAYFGISQNVPDTLISEAWKPVVEEYKNGNSLGILVPFNEFRIVRDNKYKNDSTKYNIVSPVIYLIKRNEELSPEQDIREKRKRLDEKKRKFLVDNKAGEAFNELSQKKVVYVENGDHEWFFDENFKEEKEKSLSKMNYRLKLGAGYTLPNGFVGEINPQVQISKKIFVGPYFLYTNSEKSLETITQEEPQRVLINLPLEMYWVSTGKKLTEVYKITSDFGLGLNFSYVQPAWEASLKAGLLGRKINQTFKSEGKEYIEINGTEDPLSVYNYSESNENNIKRPLFKGSPVYVGAIVEYFPFHQKENALSNLSVAGEAGYVFKSIPKATKESGVLGSLGVKYTFKKSKGSQKNESNK